MSIEVFLSLVAFALSGALTPGPNNLMVLASGVNFGYRRTVPHILGVTLGFLVVLLGVGLGIGLFLKAAPTVYTVLKFAGAGYLLYLAFRIATTRNIGRAEATSRPLTFLEAALFQWVNPKAWVLAVSAMAIYAAEDAHTVAVLIVCLVFGVITFPSLSAWTSFGAALRSWLSDPKRLKLFNGIMALLLVASLWPMLK